MHAYDDDEYPFRWERASLHHDRPNGTNLSADDVQALRSLAESQPKCAECRWQPATRLRRHRLLCKNCATVETALRQMDAVVARRDRAARRRQQGGR